MQTRATTPLRQWANRAIYAAALRPLWSIGARRQVDLPILISGSPRSGSTWLLEVLERRFEARRNWEPLDGIEQHLGSPMGERHFGLRPYLSQQDVEHPLADMLLDIVDGGAPRQLRRARNPKRGILANLGRIAGARRTVVKFTEAQRCLPFVAAHRENKAVVILRHPLAVTASALTFGGKRDFSNEPPAGPVPSPRRLPENLLRDFPQLEPFARRDMTRAEYIGLATCIDMLVPLNDAACRRNYCFVGYETLRAEPGRLAEVFSYLGDSAVLSDEELAAVTKPSARSRGQTSLGSGKPAWDGRLSESEIEQVLAIMQELGIDWYGREPGLDTGRLAKFGLAHPVV